MATTTRRVLLLSGWLLCCAAGQRLRFLVQRERLQYTEQDLAMCALAAGLVNPPPSWSCTAAAASAAPLTPVCSWSGVNCSSSLAVTAIDLTARSLAGSISSAVGQLTSLASLKLSNNTLTGNIPDSICALAALTSLELCATSITTSTVGCPTLRYVPLCLWDAPLQHSASGLPLLTIKLIGALYSPEARALCILAVSVVPSPDGVICDSTSLLPKAPVCSGVLFGPQISCDSRGHLSTLSLSGQGLQGIIVSTIGDLSFLTLLTLTNNKIHGKMPTELGLLRRLEVLALDANLLSGSVPSELGAATALAQMSLSHNLLTGSLPAELSGLTSAQVLYLQENSLSGTLPSALGRLTSLTELQLQSNGFRGSVPSELGLLTALVDLQLQQCHFTGPLPRSLCSLKDLNQLAVCDADGSGCGNLTSVPDCLRAARLLVGGLPNSTLSLTTSSDNSNELDRNPFLYGIIAIAAAILLLLILCAMRYTCRAHSALSGNSQPEPDWVNLDEEEGEPDAGDGEMSSVQESELTSPSAIGSSSYATSTEKTDNDKSEKTDNDKSEKTDNDKSDSHGQSTESVSSQS